VYGGFAEVTTVNVDHLHRRQAQRGARLGDGGRIRQRRVHRQRQHLGWRQERRLRHRGARRLWRAPLSSRTYNDFFGNSVELGHANSKRRWQHILVQARGKGASIDYGRTSLTYTGWTRG